MTEQVARYKPGKPCWFELTVADIEKGKSFYRALLGWEFGNSAAPYQQARLHGKVVAALIAGRPEGQASWIVYLASDDVAAAARAVAAAGGTVVLAPEEAPGGKRAIVEDPTGGRFGLWQGVSLPGSETFDEPGAVCWAEVSSRNPSTAAELFKSVFGFEAKKPFAGYNYVQLSIDSKSAAGILGMTHEKRPNRGYGAWLVYFQVAQADRAVTIALEHGGKVIEPAEDTPPFGRLAIIADPFGARMALIQRG
jgi:predicted enzyme related to lactoylglutathione lyase